jgi:hypothetical protein
MARSGTDNLSGTSRLLKKPSMAFSISQSEKRGFRIAPIFNGLQPSKMSVHPCTVLQAAEKLRFSTAC